MNRSIRHAAASVLLSCASSMSWSADFGALMNAIQQKLQSASPGAGGQTQGSRGNTGFGAKATESYCKELFSVASISAKTPTNESVISEEFNLNSADFFDAAIEALSAKPGFTSYAFPSPDFYQGEFETDKVNVLFNLLLSYPSPQYAAALIAESRKVPGTPQFDDQVKTDATAALAILHYRMQSKSRSPDRWKELANSIQHHEHYTSHVIWARLFKSGEMGTTDAMKAIGLCMDANGLRTKYDRDQHIKSMSQRNYQVTSNQTLFETLQANPNYPQRRRFDLFMQKYQAIRNSPDPAPELRASLGPGLAKIEQASNSAEKKARAMLSGATEASLLKAEKVSLDDAMRTRTSDAAEANVDQRTMARLAREMEKVSKLDENQKQQFASALADAHESGDRAISMMPMMLGAMMNLAMQRGMEAMPALVPYSKKLQKHSDNACTVISRWDHAAQVTNTSLGQDAESRSSLASLVEPK